MRSLFLREAPMHHILLSQLTWASAARVHVDRAGCTDSLEANLWRPLSPRAASTFGLASGKELDQKMRSLHSSSALVANVFDYWSVQDAAPLAQALGLDTPISSIAFEAQQAVGLPGNPPNLDVRLTLASREVVGIESSFGEWLVPKAGAGAPFKNKQAEPAGAAWHDCDLPACAALAGAIGSGKRSFSYLDAGRLLQHAQSLATRHGSGVSLWYLYYDWDLPQAHQHAHELDVFAAEVGAELQFRALAYQEVFQALKDGTDDRHEDYLQYLARRYFAD